MKKIVFIILVSTFIIQFLFVAFYAYKNLSERKTFKAIDKILYILRKEQDSLNVLEYCRENVKYKNTEYENLPPEKQKEADRKYRTMISRLIESGRAERFGPDKNYLRITDKGIIKSSGFTRLMWRRIGFKGVQHIIWFSIFAGMLIIIAGFLEKYFLNK